WNFRARPDQKRQFVVCLGPRHQRRVAKIGESSAGIRSRTDNDFLVSAFHKDVRHAFAQPLALRNRKEVVLTFRPRAGDQGLLVKAFRTSEDRTRHVNRVIKREGTGHTRGGVCNRRKALTECSARGKLDFTDQAAHDIVKKRPLLGIKMRGSGYEEIRDSTENFSTGGNIPLQYRCLELIYQRPACQCRARPIATVMLAAIAHLV